MKNSSSKIANADKVSNVEKINTIMPDVEKSCKDRLDELDGFNSCNETQTSSSPAKARELTMMEGQYPSGAALQVAQLSLRCLELDPRSRPSMKEVIEVLKEIEAQAPGQPFKS
ncbi:hypothetical protein Q3G72_033119 [Acer saccharum]|nr:hypothetical protein Q3G72_033119 [Acer saccharum]